MKVSMAESEMEVDGVAGLVANLRRLLNAPGLRDDQLSFRRSNAFFVYPGWGSIVSFSVDGFGHIGFCEDPLLIKKPDIWDAIVAASRS